MLAITHNTLTQQACITYVYTYDTFVSIVLNMGQQGTLYFNPYKKDSRGGS